ncbi:hypothetical protein NKH70_22880 [Mesorhizobium sp. M0991]|uniref:VHL beta domain-containing protein n=1 Tax=Mesorhizobium sp. M0991 TaxID=2957043 RepID=UPI00333BC116
MINLARWITTALLGTLVVTLLGTWPSFSATPVSCSEEGSRHSVSYKRKVVIEFRNNSSMTTSLYWLDYYGARKSYGTVGPGQSLEINTFVTHPWLVADENGNCLEIVLPEKGTSRDLALINEALRPDTSGTLADHYMFSTLISAMTCSRMTATELSCGRQQGFGPAAPFLAATAKQLQACANEGDACGFDEPPTVTETGLSEEALSSLRANDQVSSSYKLSYKGQSYDCHFLLTALLHVGYGSGEPDSLTYDSSFSCW